MKDFELNGEGSFSALADEKNSPKVAIRAKTNRYLLTAQDPLVPLIPRSLSLIYLVLTFQHRICK